LTDPARIENDPFQPVRVSVGIEAIEDILDDFDQALRAI